MRDWGSLDFAGAIDWMSQRYPGAPLMVVGHSHGGHALLLAPNNTKIVRAMTVATQSGYWRYTAPVERHRVWFLLNVLAPTALRMQGYVPGSKLGLGEDLAPGVMREWREWCNLPNYFFDDPTMRELLQAGKDYSAPTLVVSLSDDLWGTPQAVEAFAKNYRNAQRRVIVPSEFGLSDIGHFGFFRSQNGPKLWPLVTEYFGLMEVAA
jgi:predicted alpha/beta hydrolase